MLPQAIGSGLVGAITVTAINETARQFIPEAPRLDILGMRALSRTIKGLGQRPPKGDSLRYTALAGDILSNTLFYSLAGMAGRRRAPLTGALLGLMAGIGAVVLPETLGLGRKPTRRTPATQAMSIAWYTLGGLAAGRAYQRVGEG